MRLSGHEGAASWEKYWTEMNEDKHNQQSNKDGKKGGGIKTN